MKVRQIKITRATAVVSRKLCHAGLKQDDAGAADLLQHCGLLAGQDPWGKGLACLIASMPQHGGLVLSPA